MGRSFSIVVSTWQSADDWKNWEKNPERREIQARIDKIVTRPTKAKIYVHAQSDFLLWDYPDSCEKKGLTLQEGFILLGDPFISVTGLDVTQGEVPPHPNPPSPEAVSQ